MSNLARGADTKIQAFFEAGVANLLMDRLENSPMSVADLTEACWLLTYFTAHELDAVKLLVDAGLVNILEKHEKLAETSPECAVPLVRVLGNVSAADSNSAVAIMQNVTFSSLLTRLLSSEHR